MKAYKAFEKDLTCRGYKFSETDVNITSEANCRQNGFHCAENPLDCLDYYPDWDNSVYYIVEAGGDINEDGTDSKISCTELTLLQKLTVENFIAESLTYMYKHPKRQWHHRVKSERAKAKDGFEIVRGKNPIFKGSKGVVVGLAKESENSDEIISLSLFRIDGVKFLPDIWYDIHGNPADIESGWD